MTAVDFNNLYKGIKLYKFMNDDLIHDGNQFRLGLNDFTNPSYSNYSFDGDDHYLIDFVEELFCYLDWRHFGKIIACVEIPNDACISIDKVYADKNEIKFLTNKLIITKFVRFEDMPDDFWISILHKDGLALQLINNQTDELCKIAVHNNDLALAYVNNQTEELCKIAIQNNGIALAYVNNQTKKICELAIRNNVAALEYVREQTEELCKLAIQQDEFSLYYVKEQYLTEELCKFAVQQNGLVLGIIKEEFKTDDVCKLAVKQNGIAIQFVPKQTDELCKLAILNNRIAYCFVEDPTIEMYMLVIPNCLSKSGDDIADEICKFAAGMDEFKLRNKVK